MSDRARAKTELDEHLRAAGVSIPPGREDAVLSHYVELNRALAIVRAWVPTLGLAPAPVIRAETRNGRDD